jgi:hypothetical protein
VKTADRLISLTELLQAARLSPTSLARERRQQSRRAAVRKRIKGALADAHHPDPVLSSAPLCLIPTTMVLKLFGVPLSVCTRRVATVLVEKKVPFEFVSVDFSQGEQKAPAYLAHQPFAQVPYIVGDFRPVVAISHSFTGRRWLHPLREPRNLPLPRRKIPHPRHEAHPHRPQGQSPL